MAGLPGAHCRPENRVRSPRHPGRVLAPAHPGAGWPCPDPRPRPAPRPHGLIGGPGRPLKTLEVKHQLPTASAAPDRAFSVLPGAVCMALEGNNFYCSRPVSSLKFYMQQKPHHLTDC